MDRYGRTLFSGAPSNSVLGSRLSSGFIDSFGGRNVLGVADAFGESFLYYSTRNHATSEWQRNVTFVKRVMAFGVPVLIGAITWIEYLDRSAPGRPPAWLVGGHHGPAGEPSVYPFH